MLLWDKNPSNKICNLFGMETKSLRGALGSRNKCVCVCVCVWGGGGGGGGGGGRGIAWNLEGGEEFQTWNRSRVGIVKPRIVGVGVGTWNLERGGGVGIGHDFMLHV